MGLYQTGRSKSVKFDNPGASYVFCNIHPEMGAVVLVVDSRYFGVSDATGRVFIANVPAGKYIVHSWYDDTTRPMSEDLAEPIIVSDAKDAEHPISLVISRTGGEEETIQEGEERSAHSAEQR